MFHMGQRSAPAVRDAIQFARTSCHIRLMMVNPRQPTEADLLGILREAF